jgi:15-hydroxyprostaglandin dehydrogenase (NAD)
VDITDYDQQAQAFKTTFDWGDGRLDLFFANAGIGDSDSLYKDTFGLDDKTGLPKKLDLRAMDVNLNAMIQGIHLARHIFTEKNENPGGKIVTSSSVVGIYGNYAMPLYTSSKHGVVGLVRSLAPVYAKDNITINSLCPTLIETNLMPKEYVREFHVPEETTPMSTVLKAIDRIVQDSSLTGQVMELTLDKVVFKPRPEYSTPNVEWMFDQMLLWEKVCAPGLPRKPGDNAAAITSPEEGSF